MMSFEDACHITTRSSCEVPCEITVIIKEAGVIQRFNHSLPHEHEMQLDVYLLIKI